MTKWGLLLAAVGVFGMAAASGKILIKQTNYFGLQSSVHISNGVVEAIIVPAVARVMQFRFVGDEDGPFWENTELRGKVAKPYSEQWANFGGDKVWPAPQSDWVRIRNRAWPPPDTFDSLPLLAEMREDYVELVSSTDPHYGIRFRRMIELDKSKPIMTITTEYQKVDGEPINLAIWTITQVKDPELIRIPLKGGGKKAPYVLQIPAPPPDLKVTKEAITLTRDPKANHKIGAYGDRLIWIGKNWTLEISASREKGDYPDQGSSAEVYTNADPLAYVELEMLGPLKQLKEGDKIKHQVTYKLGRR